MSEDYIETEDVSVTENLSRAVARVLGGFALVLGATIGLFWNEGNYVKQRDCINEVEENTVIVEDVNVVNPANEGKPVFLSGSATTKSKITDKEFGIMLNAFNLKRNVEFYQWEETKDTEEQKKAGGGTRTVTTYSYDKEWVSEPINSGNFKRQEGHTNNVLYESKSKEFQAPRAKLGAYTLPKLLIQEINNPEEVHILNIKKIEPIIEKLSKYVEKEFIHVDNNVIYLGEDPNVAAIGDVRITFTFTPPKQDVSFVAQLQDNSFVPYLGEACQDSYAYHSLFVESLSAEQLFENDRETNTMMTWAIRGIGFGALWMGFTFLFSIFQALANIIPIVGGLFEGVATVVAGILAFTWSFVVIAIAWLFYRPFISIAIFIMTGAIIGTIITIQQKKKAAQQDEIPS